MLEPEQHGRARRDLASALRELRRAAGLSGERLAVRCAMSQTKISRIETGRVLPSVLDVERILKALEVPEPVSADLLNLARAANVDYASWRAYARVGLWQKQAELRALERSASTVRMFLPAIPSGLLQTEEYARQTLTPTVPGRPARDVERVLQARMERQNVLDDPSRRFAFLLTEQAVRWRRAAGNDVMAHQVSHLVEVAAKPHVDLAVIPQSAAVLASPLNIFVIYDERLVTVELFSGEVVLRDPRDVDYHVSLFDYFMGHALTGKAATTFLTAVADLFMRQRD
jgi:transcriptional regulator with XRE-family HTH domain